MFGEIVIAVDASENAERAAEVGRDLAKATGDKVVVVHVREGHFAGRGGVLTTEAAGEAEALVRLHVAAMEAAGVPVTGEVHQAAVLDVAHAIVEAADAHDAGLVVTGTHGRGTVGAALLGSVARTLLHEAHRPVLVVPPTGRRLPAQ